MLITANTQPSKEDLLFQAILELVRHLHYIYKIKGWYNFRQISVTSDFIGSKTPCENSNNSLMLFSLGLLFQCRGRTEHQNLKTCKTSLPSDSRRIHKIRWKISPRWSLFSPKEWTLKSEKKKLVFYWKKVWLYESPLVAFGTLIGGVLLLVQYNLFKLICMSEQILPLVPHVQLHGPKQLERHEGRSQSALQSGLS